MRRSQRLRHQADFNAVYKRGKVFAERLLVVRVLENGALPAARFGFVVSKRLGNAVKRNHIKRQLRSAALSSGANGQVDIVVTARVNAAQANYHELESALHGIFKKAGLGNHEENR